MSWPSGRGRRSLREQAPDLGVHFLEGAFLRAAVNETHNPLPVDDKKIRVQMAYEEGKPWLYGTIEECDAPRHARGRARGSFAADVRHVLPGAEGLLHRARRLSRSGRMRHPSLRR